MNPLAPVVAPPPAAIPTNITSTKLQTYEDCLKLIHEISALSDIGAIKLQLGQLEAFFTARMTKRANKGGEGNSVVRDSLVASRRFKAWEPKALA